VTTLLLFSIVAAWAGHRSEHQADFVGTQPGICIVDVIHSEELPGAPIFQHLVRARLRVIPPDGPPFEMVVERFKPWQVPPPRRGQRLRLACGPAILNSFSFY
jgi:hypothetical protein